MPARLSISLAALVSNYELMRSRSGGELAGVVKADAYGMGAAQVATALHQAGCQEFFVATAEEGVRLRAHLPDVGIWVLEGATPHTVTALAESNLKPVLNSLQQIELWQTGAAALHVDTGMHRLGLPMEEVGQALNMLTCPIELLLSHFARADEQDPESTQRQVSAFDDAMRVLRTKYPQARTSFSNSAAALAGGVGDDLARGGVALYGVNPFVSSPNPMHAVACLTAPILQLREVPEGTEVGYGGTFVTQRPTRLATVAAGYADGVPRLLSNTGSVWVQGQHAPIVGRVTMDMIHVDVTDCADISLQDEVEILGAHVAIDDVAAAAQTIGYEILTGLDAVRRLRREYLDTLLP